MSDLHRLVYTSVRRSKCDEEEINKILASCKKNNPGKDITGVLLHSNKRFIQYLEGPKDVIQGLYENIKDDDRHSAVHLRNFAPIEERIFPSWHMGYKDVSKNAVEFQTAVTSNDKKVFQDLIENDGDVQEEGIRVLKLFFELS